MAEPTGEPKSIERQREEAKQEAQEQLRELSDLVSRLPKGCESIVERVKDLGASLKNHFENLDEKKLKDAIESFKAAVKNLKKELQAALDSSSGEKRAFECPHCREKNSKGVSGQELTCVDCFHTFNAPEEVESELLPPTLDHPQDPHRQTMRFGSGSLGGPVPGTADPSGQALGGDESGEADGAVIDLTPDPSGDYSADDDPTARAETPKQIFEILGTFDPREGLLKVGETDIHMTANNEVTPTMVLSGDNKKLKFYYTDANSRSSGIVALSIDESGTYSVQNEILGGTETADSVDEYVRLIREGVAKITRELIRMEDEKRKTDAATEGETFLPDQIREQVLPGANARLEKIRKSLDDFEGTPFRNELNFMIGGILKWHTRLGEQSTNEKQEENKEKFIKACEEAEGEITKRANFLNTANESIDALEKRISQLENTRQHSFTTDINNVKRVRDRVWGASGNRDFEQQSQIFDTEIRELEARLKQKEEASATAIFGSNSLGGPTPEDGTMSFENERTKDDDRPATEIDTSHAPPPAAARPDTTPPPAAGDSSLGSIDIETGTSGTPRHPIDVIGSGPPSPPENGGDGNGNGGGEREGGVEREPKGPTPLEILLQKRGLIAPDRRTAFFEFNPKSRVAQIPVETNISAMQIYNDIVDIYKMAEPGPSDTAETAIAKNQKAYEDIAIYLNKFDIKIDGEFRRFLENVEAENPKIAGLGDLLTNNRLFRWEVKKQANPPKATAFVAGSEILMPEAELFEIRKLQKRKKENGIDYLMFVRDMMAELVLGQDKEKEKILRRLRLAFNSSIFEAGSQTQAAMKLIEIERGRDLVENETETQRREIVDNMLRLFMDRNNEVNKQNEILEDLIKDQYGKELGEAVSSIALVVQKKGQTTYIRKRSRRGRRDRYIPQHSGPTARDENKDLWDMRTISAEKMAGLTRIFQTVKAEGKIQIAKLSLGPRDSSKVTNLSPNRWDVYVNINDDLETIESILRSLYPKEAATPAEPEPTATLTPEQRKKEIGRLSQVLINNKAQTVEDIVAWITSKPESTDTRKIGIAIMLLGDDLARKIFKLISEQDIENILKQIEQLDGVSDTECHEVLIELVAKPSAPTNTEWYETYLERPDVENVDIPEQYLLAEDESDEDYFEKIVGKVKDKMWNEDYRWYDLNLLRRAMTEQDGMGEKLLATIMDENKGALTKAIANFENSPDDDKNIDLEQVKALLELVPSDKVDDTFARVAEKITALGAEDSKIKKEIKSLKKNKVIRGLEEKIPYPFFKLVHHSEKFLGALDEPEFQTKLSDVIVGNDTKKMVDQVLLYDKGDEMKSYISLNDERQCVLHVNATSDTWEAEVRSELEKMKLVDPEYWKDDTQQDTDRYVLFLAQEMKEQTDQDDSGDLKKINSIKKAMSIEGGDEALQVVERYLTDLCNKIGGGDEDRKNSLDLIKAFHGLAPSNNVFQKWGTLIYRKLTEKGAPEAESYKMYAVDSTSVANETNQDATETAPPPDQTEPPAEPIEPPAETPPQRPDYTGIRARVHSELEAAYRRTAEEVAEEERRMAAENEGRDPRERPVLQTGNDNVGATDLEPAQDLTDSQDGQSPPSDTRTSTKRKEIWRRVRDVFSNPAKRLSEIIVKDRRLSSSLEEQQLDREKIKEIIDRIERLKGILDNNNFEGLIDLVAGDTTHKKEGDAITLNIEADDWEETILQMLKGDYTPDDSEKDKEGKAGDTIEIPTDPAEQLQAIESLVRDDERLFIYKGVVFAEDERKIVLDRLPIVQEMLRISGYPEKVGLAGKDHDHMIHQGDIQLNIQKDNWEKELERLIGVQEIRSALNSGETDARFFSFTNGNFTLPKDVIMERVREATIILDELKFQGDVGVDGHASNRLNEDGRIQLNIEQDGWQDKLKKMIFEQRDTIIKGWSSQDPRLRTYLFKDVPFSDKTIKEAPAIISRIIQILDETGYNQQVCIVGIGQRSRKQKSTGLIQVSIEDNDWETKLRGLIAEQQTT